MPATHRALLPLEQKASAHPIPKKDTEHTAHAHARCSDNANTNKDHHCKMTNRCTSISHAHASCAPAASVNVPSARRKMDACPMLGSPEHAHAPKHQSRKIQRMSFPHGESPISMPLVALPCVAHENRRRRGTRARPKSSIAMLAPTPARRRTLRRLHCLLHNEL